MSERFLIGVVEQPVVGVRGVLHFVNSPRADPEFSRPFRFAQGLSRCLGKIIYVKRVVQQSGSIVGHQFRKSAASGCDHRCCGRESLSHHKAKRFLPR